MSAKAQTTSTSTHSDSGWRNTLSEALSAALSALNRIAKAVESPRQEPRRVTTLALARNFSDRAALGLGVSQELYGTPAGYLQKNATKPFPPTMTVWWYPDEDVLRFENEGKKDIWVPADSSMFRWWSI